MTNLPDGRYVDDEPFDPVANIQTLERQDLDAPAWLLIWRKFRKHKLGLVSGIFLLLCYLMLPVAGFIAPYTPNERNSDYLYAPPQSINLFHEGEFGRPLCLSNRGRSRLGHVSMEIRNRHDNPHAVGILL